jgi:IPT/TIG domain
MLGFGRRNPNQDQAGSSRDSEAKRERPLLVVLSAVILLLLTLIISLGVLAALYRWLAGKDLFLPELTLPMLLLASIVLFIGAIAVLVNVYRSVGLQDKQYALGLPDGSVRAVIALILIFLFFVAITFIYFSIARGQPNTTLRGLTPAQFAQIPATDLISSTPVPAAGTPTSYTVTIRGTASSAEQDIGKNLIVLLGTLITAVTAFYFGTNSATSAARKGGEIHASGTAPPTPQVTGAVPSIGPSGGGTSVVVTGSGFTGATAVNFGSNLSTNVIVNSDTQITAVSPPGTGTVAITISTPGGVTATSAAAQFAYAPLPQVDSADTLQGPIAGGTPVLLKGSGFTGATAVNFGTTPATDFTVNSDTQITAVSPPGTGTVAITITTPGGESNINNNVQHTYS